VTDAFRAACIQLRSGEDVAANIRAASALIREAAVGGARFIATPENTTLMAADAGAKLASSHSEAGDPALPVFAALAKELGVHLLIGSLAIKVSETRTANRSFLFAPDGQVTARYEDSPVRRRAERQRGLRRIQHRGGWRQRRAGGNALGQHRHERLL